jgi:hypothetical protein
MLHKLFGKKKGLNRLGKRRKSKPRYNRGSSKKSGSNLSISAKKRNIRKSKRLNPRFARFRRSVLLGLIIGFIGFSTYLIFFSAYFQIIEIQISDENFTSQELADKIRATAETSLNENLIFLKIDELETSVISSFPELETLRISKDYPNKVMIEFAEYPMVVNIVNESSTVKKSYILNSIGFAMKEDFENPELPYIKIRSDEPINAKNQVLGPVILNYILEAKAYYEDRFGMKIKEIDYRKSAREVHLLTEKDFYIWLDIQRGYEEQLKKLKKALVKLDIYSESLAYIDLRIAGNSGDKIIYKRR